MQQNSFFHMTAISSNVKTGPIPVTTSSRNTCPSNCKLKGNGCYAENYPLNAHWNAVSNGKRGKGYETIVKAVSRLPKGQLWRANQAGDLSPLADNLIDQKALSALTKANKGKRGFTYTHYPVMDSSSWQNLANRKAIRDANNDGFIVNLSANNYVEADAMQSIGIAPVVTLQAENAARVEFTPQGNKVITCPATYMDYVTCASCKLCAIPKEKREIIIGFPVHGIKKKQAHKVFMLKKEA